MFKKLLSACVLVSTFMSVSACSEDKIIPVVDTASTSVEAATDKTTPLLIEDEALVMKLRLLLRSEISSIKASPMPGLYEVLSDAGLSYVSKDGKFFIQGDLYGIDEVFENYTENSLMEVRLGGIKKFEKDMIVYPAEDEKYVVNIFTDITCGYCRKLHALVDEYNALGITIRYLAFPRSGITDRSGNFTKGFEDLRSIWCHENPAEALTKAKLSRNVAHRICETTIAEQLSFGRQAGVSGTPAILFSDGSITSGFMPPEALLQALKSKQL